MKISYLFHRHFSQHKAITVIKHNQLSSAAGDKFAPAYRINDAQITVFNSTQWGHYPVLSPRTIKRSLISRLLPQYAADVSDLLSNRPGQRGYLQPLGPTANPGSPALNRCHSINVSGSEKRFAGAALRNAPFTPADSRTQETPPLPASGRASPSGARSTGPGGHAAPGGRRGCGRRGSIPPPPAPRLCRQLSPAVESQKIHTHTHTAVHTYRCLCAYTCMCECIRVVRIYMCVYIHVEYVCIYLCIRTYISVYTDVLPPVPPRHAQRCQPRGAPRAARPGFSAPAAPSGRWGSRG